MSPSFRADPPLRTAPLLRAGPLLRAPALLRAVAVVLAVGASAACGGEGGPEQPAFDARLSRMPVGLINRSGLSGEGATRAALHGDTLVVEGTFGGVGSRVTGARLHRARPGLRGPGVADLEVTDQAEEDEGGGWAGSFVGRVPLVAEMRAALDSGALYVQLSSEANPDGVLRGWLFARDSGSPARRGGSAP